MTTACCCRPATSTASSARSTRSLEGPRRGSWPLIEVVLGHDLPVLQLVGIVVSSGLVSLTLDGGRLSRSAIPALGAAVATGVAIAGYRRRRFGGRPRPRSWSTPPGCSCCGGR